MPSIWLQEAQPELKQGNFPRYLPVQSPRGAAAPGPGKLRHRKTYPGRGEAILPSQCKQGAAELPLEPK